MQAKDVGRQLSFNEYDDEHFQNSGNEISAQQQCRGDAYKDMMQHMSTSFQQQLLHTLLQLLGIAWSLAKNMIPRSEFVSLSIEHEI